MRLSEFLTDYIYEEDSDAVKQAKQMGLVYKGFGRWADQRTNKVTHKTQSGRLIPVDSTQGELPIKDPKVEPRSGQDLRRQFPTPKKDKPVKQPDPTGQGSKGVGQYSIKKTGSDTDHGDPDQYEPDVTTTQYDILRNGEKVGEMTKDDYFGYVRGNLYGKDFPSGLDRYGRWDQESGPLGNLHRFLKSKTGRKWASTGVLKNKDLGVKPPDSQPPKQSDQSQKGKQLASLLQKHDWYFDKSDDQRSWRMGGQEKKEIEDYIKNSGIAPNLAKAVWDKYAHPDFKDQSSMFGLDDRDGISTIKTKHGSRSHIPADKTDQYSKDVMKRGGDAARRLSGKNPNK